MQASAENQELEEAMEAMLALGYKATELKKIKKFFEGTTDTAENYIKSALKMLVQIGAEHDKTLFVGQDDQSALYRLS